MFNLSQVEVKALLVLRSNIKPMSKDEVATRATFFKLAKSVELITLMVEEALYGLRAARLCDLTLEGWELTDAGYSMADRIRSAEAAR